MVDKYKDIDWKSDIFGCTLRESVRDNFDSRLFVQSVMLLPNTQELLYNDEGWNWTDEWVLYDKLKRLTKPKVGKTLDAYFLWFTGYLYKYWSLTRKLKMCEVYKYLPIEKLESHFDFLHTQDWDKVIDIALNEMR